MSKIVPRSKVLFQNSFMMPSLAVDVLYRQTVAVISGGCYFTVSEV